MYKNYVATLRISCNNIGIDTDVIKQRKTKTKTKKASERKGDAISTTMNSEPLENNNHCATMQEEREGRQAEQRPIVQIERESPLENHHDHGHDPEDQSERPSSSTDSLPFPHEPDALYLCSKRLQRLLQKIQNDEKVDKKDLVSNLSYAVDVLNAVAEENTRRSEDDNEMSEIQSIAVVPDEVRDWLASTFTRSMSTAKAPLRERLKFKSVVQAVRAGITVERLYRRLSSLPFTLSCDIQSFLSENIDVWSMDVFRLHEISSEHSLKIVGYHLLHRYDVIRKQKISVSSLEAFLCELEAGYSRSGNPYHNVVHAADIAQTVHYFLAKSKIVHWLTDLEIFSVLVAALVHDVDHTGTTNGFHMNTDSDLAILYNDRSVLENHHLATCFKLLQSDDCNIIRGLKRDDYRTFRSNVIEMVMATDMSFHFQQLKTMKSSLSSPDRIDKTRALSFILHSADISHPAKTWDLHSRWTELLLEEFFRQGDKEKELNLPPSPLCDRASTLVPESQIGFVDFIVGPTFSILGDLLEKVTNQELSSSSSSGSTFAGLNREVIDEANETDCTSTSSGKTSVSQRNYKKLPSRSQLFVFERVWDQHLTHNKLTWQDLAKRDALARAEAAKTQKT